VTGSASMFSEALHSLVDTETGLLVFARAASGTPPTVRSAIRTVTGPRGVLFWSMVVAMCIFAYGWCRVDFLPRRTRMIAPQPLDSPLWVTSVLRVRVRVRRHLVVDLDEELRPRPRSAHTVDGDQAEQDPTTFVVVLEDSAALIGVVVAGRSADVDQGVRRAEFDAAGSLVIGACS